MMDGLRLRHRLRLSAARAPMSPAAPGTQAHASCGYGSAASASNATDLVDGAADGVSADVLTGASALLASVLS